METDTTPNAALADAGNTRIAGVTPAAKPSRTRRMAREAGAESQPVADTLLHAAAPATPRKIDGIIALLRREEGATLVEMTEATGWLPHTARAALTGLRKKGHGVVKAKRGETTCYHLGEAR